MEVHRKYNNVIVKSETKDYDADFEVQNDISCNTKDECDENNFKIKKEIVKNEEEDIDISEFDLQANCSSPYPKFEMKHDLDDDNLDIYKKVKTESQYNDLCSNVDQSVGEFPENCDVDEKIDISGVNLLSTENNYNLTFDIKDEKPRIFESKQSSSVHLQQEEVNNDSYQATNETVLNMHIASVHNNHEQKIKINCDFCGKSFSGKMTLDDHILKNHKDKTCLIKSKIHTCTMCLYQTIFKSNLNKHIDSVHKKQKINCDFCDKSFSTKQICDSHVLKNHKDKTNLIKSKIYTCTICSYQTTLKYKFNMHSNSVHSKLKINCDFCDNSFSAKIICDNHVLKKHKDKTSLIKSKTHTCTICSYQTTFRSSLNTHIDSVHNQHKIKVRCEFCDKTFATKPKRDDHVLKNHEDKTGLIKSKIQTCAICSYQTTSKSNLNAHFDSIHNEQKIKMRCEFCDKCFSRKQNRDDHVLKKHKDKTSLIESKIHTCTICSFQTTYKYILDTHIGSIHNEQKIKIVCEFCKRSFTAKQKRDDHILKKHKDKSNIIKSKIHTCTICSYQTTYKYRLDTHIYSVHNEQKIKIGCEFCDKSFLTKRIYDYHVLKNHKDKTSSIKATIYSCTICRYQTTSNFSLNRHIILTHNKLNKE